MNELASLERAKDFLFYPGKEGRASSIESNGACVSKRIKGASSDCLAQSVNGTVSEQAALASNDTLSLASDGLAQRAPERVGLFNFDLLEAVEGTSCLLLAACAHVEGKYQAL